LTQAGRLIAVARAGVGLDNIDVAAADDLGVVVLSPRGANSRSVAEHTLALALALARGLVRLDAAARAGIWQREAGRELAGGMWGLLGAGATGCAVARLVRALGMTVVGYDPYADSAAAASAGVELAALDAVLAAADVISVHLPATPETHGLLDSARLARMRPGALLINVGRGEVINEPDLLAVLESGHLGGAGLDVRCAEPSSPGRLELLPNVVLTPHVAGLTKQSQHRIVTALARDLERVLAGAGAAEAAGAHRRPSRLIPTDLR
jgi:phosphoglycerate dehydrogenase-like enzyme